VPPPGAGEVSTVKVLPVAIWATRPCGHLPLRRSAPRQCGGVPVVMASWIESRRVAGLRLCSREMLALWGVPCLSGRRVGDGRAV
jgi:hypothetical protein